MTKFSAEVPKGDGWGVDDIVQEITQEIIGGKKSRLVPVIGVIDVKEVKIDPESGNHIAVVRIRRLESLTTLDRIRDAQKMLLQQVAERRGEGTVLPFEEADIIQRAFGEGTVGNKIQDDEEADIDAHLTESDRVARHLVAVHDFDPGILSDDELTAADHARAHDLQHAADPDDRAWPDHDPESTMWRRVDLETILGDAEEGDPDPLADNDPDTDTGDTADTAGDAGQGDGADGTLPIPGVTFDDGESGKDQG